MKNKILFTLCLLFGLMMINAGLDKLFHYMPVPKGIPQSIVTVFTAFTQIGWLLPLVGVAEIVGGILFIFPKTRALGAIIILPVFVGILLVNTVTEPLGLPLMIIMLAILGWAMFENRQKYLQLIKQ